VITDVAALFVDRRGEYPRAFEHWYDEKRDARTYAGELPIIGHPPCQRWCRLAGLVEARWGHKRGEDGGLFAYALETVRRVGGVLEHPAYSDAWAAYGLPRPPTGGGWVAGANSGEWTCYVEQWRYGHRARKATWLYVVGLSSVEPPALRFGLLSTRGAAGQLMPWRDSNRRYPHSAGRVHGPIPTAVVGYCANHGGGGAPDLRVVGRAKHDPNDRRLRLTKKQAIATPPEFQAELLMLARWAVAE
jgi:hypothetical protein